MSQYIISLRLYFRRLTEEEFVFNITILDVPSIYNQLTHVRNVH